MVNIKQQFLLSVLLSDMRYLLISLMVFLSGHASAHEWTPTYPKPTMSHVAGVIKVEMRLFNGREDIEYYDINVFDSEWNPTPFALSNGKTMVRVKPNTRLGIDVYIRQKDLPRAVYVCSKTKPLAEDESKTMLFSRICSKIK